MTRPSGPDWLPSLFSYVFRRRIRSERTLSFFFGLAVSQGRLCHDCHDSPMRVLDSCFTLLMSRTCRVLFLFMSLFVYVFYFCLAIFCLACSQWLSIWSCLDTGRSSSSDFLCVALGSIFMTMSCPRATRWSALHEHHRMRCLFCPSLIRYPILFERSHGSGITFE